MSLSTLLGVIKSQALKMTESPKDTKSKNLNINAQVLVMVVDHVWSCLYTEFQLWCFTMYIGDHLVH